MLTELIAEDKRRVFELEQQLAEFEKGNKSIHASDISLGLDEMAKRLNELEIQANNESKGRRDDMRRRVAHLRSTHTHVKQSLDVIVRRRDQQKYDNERRYIYYSTTMLSRLSSKFGEYRDLFRNSRGDSETDINIDLEMAENHSLDRSSSMVNSYIAQGQETLSELLSQKDRLKNIQRKVNPFHFRFLRHSTQ